MECDSRVRPVLAPQLSNGLGGATLRFDQLIDSDNTAVASSPLDHTLESLVERSVYVMDSDRLPHLQRVVYKAGSHEPHC